MGFALLSVHVASAQPALPVVVEADVITYDSVRRVITAQGNVRLTTRRYRLVADAAQYDLVREVITAMGRVRLMDDRQRELRGRSLRFDVRAEEGVMEPIEGVVDPPRRVYVRGGRLEFTPMRLTLSEGLVTSCDPGNPLLYVTARRIEIVPNEELVAHDAAVFLAGRRVYSTRRFVASLVPGEPAVLIPGVGGNAVDGYWVDTRSRVRAGDARGLLHLKYGTTSGLFGLLTLRRRDPAYTATLRLGRTQTADERAARDLLPYWVAELGAETTPRRIAGTPFSWTAATAAAWFDDATARVSTTRVDGRLEIASERLPVAPRLTFGVEGGWRISAYGTGDVRTIGTAHADLVYALDDATRVRLAYSVVTVRGRSPLVVDDVDSERTVSLGVVRVVPDRYRLAAAVAYNAFVPETKVSASASVVVSPSFELGASAVYNTRLQAYEDIDYHLRYLCDCLEVVVRYRQMRRDVSIEVGLAGFTERRPPFVPRSRPPLVLPPPGAQSEGSDLH